MVLLIAAGSTLGEVAGAVVIGPGLAVGFVGSWAAADVIANYFTSAQFAMAGRPGDDSVEPPHPST